MGKSGGRGRGGFTCIAMAIGIGLAVFILARSAAFVRNRSPALPPSGTPEDVVQHSRESHTAATPPPPTEMNPVADHGAQHHPTATESVAAAIEGLKAMLGQEKRPVCGGQLHVTETGLSLGHNSPRGGISGTCQKFRKALTGKSVPPHQHGTSGLMDDAGALGTASRFLRVAAQANADTKHGVSLERVAAHGGRMKKLAETSLVPSGSTYNSSIVQTVTRLAPGHGARHAPHSPALAPLLDALGLHTTHPLPTKCDPELMLVISVPPATQRAEGGLAGDARHDWGKLARCVGVIVLVADADVDSEKARNAMRYAASKVRSALGHCDAVPKEVRAAAASPVIDVLSCSPDAAGGPVSGSPSQVHACSALPQPTWTVTGAIKYGTKTGIYRAQRSVHLAVAAESKRDSDVASDQGGSEPVVLKQFNMLQYATFQGFRSIVESVEPRSSLINFPDRTCVARGEALSDSVFQEQPFVKGVNLKSFVGARMKKLRQMTPTSSRGRLSSFMTPSERLDVALQILCIFDYLHAHRAGPFAFDDNHPEQYMITELPGDAAEAAGARLSVTLIDIDTLQRATSATAALSARGNHSSAGAQREGGFSTRCRCFYCRGRSNCMFINSPEGYAACGQDNGDHGDREAPHAARAGKHCTLRSDAWFIAQVLLFVSTGAAPWEGLGLGEVTSRLRAGEVPSVPAEHDQTLAPVIEKLFKERLPPVDAAAELQALCATGGHTCRTESCPLPL